MFRSLRLHNYRAWFFGAMVSFIGQWMQTTAMTWVVLTELTDEDATAMGITLALQLGPSLVLVGVTGWAADRFDRRRLIAATQSSLLVGSTAIGALCLAGVMTLPLMWALALVIGVVNAFDMPARQSFVSDMAGEHTANAVALNSMLFSLARLVGPAAAGLLLGHVDSGWVFLVNAATYVAMLIGLAVMRPEELAPRDRSKPVGRLADGIRHVLRRPDFLVLFGIVALISAFALNFQIYVSTMALGFGRGPDGLGILMGAFAIGALAGTLLVARRGRARLRLVVAGAGGFGVVSLASAAMPSFWWYAASLVLVGFTLMGVLPTANAYVQTTAEPALRGRVLALYSAVLMGTTPLGAPLIGWIDDHWGSRVAIVVASVAGLVAAAIGVVWMLASRRRAERLPALGGDSLA